MAKKKAKFGKTWKAQILLIGFMISAVLFSAISVLLAVGMIPTIVAGIVDRTKGKVRTLTIGAINFGGCAPFAVEVFKQGNTMQTAMAYILQPRTIVVMYFAAGMGYMIDWAMTGIVSSMMVQKAKKRVKEIGTQQKELIDRWGPEVTGTIPLDEFGFPRESVASATIEE